MKNFKNKIKPAIFAVLMLTVGFSLLYLGGCSAEKNNSTAPVNDNSTKTYDISSPELATAIAVQNKYTKDLMQTPGVVGVGTGLDNNGNPAIIVFTLTADEAKSKGNNIESIPLPAKLDNIPVVVDAEGSFQAYALTGKYNPVPNGASIINPVEGCAAGTLGCLVTDGTSKYILSCNHVLANENAATIGDPVYQPGTYDSKPQCSTTYPNTIGHLSAFCPISFNSGTNTIDAAIAITDGSPSSTGATPSGYYGFPGSTTASPALNLQLQKVGRTTVKTTGRITAINATVTVQYSANQLATFVGQIVTSNRFSQAGDSGSLVVTNNSAKHPVGLLFAGTNSGVTILNPISNVLSYFGVSVVSQ